jgi:aspartyl protease family protein
MSPGTRGLISQMASWVVGLGLIAVALVFQDELTAAGSLMLGLPQGEAEIARPRARPPAAKQEPASSGNGVVEIAADRNGHFLVTAEINGRSVDVMVDSGASIVALPYEDAERAGIFVKDVDFTGRVSTANGTGRVAPVMLDRVSIGEITVRNVRAAVAEPGRLNMTLLGMSFLSRLQRADMRSGKLVLQE